MNKEVSFKIAKLLKEKGFDEQCSHAYKEVETPVLYVHQDKKYNNSFKKEWQNTVRKNSHMDNAVINRYSAPTIAQVIDWLYEKHGIWISVECDCYGKLWYAKLFVASEKLWDDLDKRHEVISSVKKFSNEHNSRTEAYEAAVEYTLNNLI